ncbi:hypothetical protein CS0771_32040 [Catellatospora sp. IY07-71]|nr:hypothetical protein CS0771_32040 [Catellatospora sp. IY07-71]
MPQCRCARNRLAFDTMTGMLTTTDAPAAARVNTRRWGGAALVAVAALLVGLPVSRDAPLLWAALAGVLALISAAALALRDPAVLRAVLLVDLVVACAAAGTWLLPAGLLTWPTTVLVAMAAGVGIARLRPELRPVAPWLRRGRWTPELPWLVLAVVVLSAAALTAWAWLADPPVPPFVANLGDRPVAVIAAGVIGFSVVNAVAEEFLYRGVLQTELTTLAGAATAIIVQAVAFGVAHWGGFPSGWMGVGMSAAYGLLLGVIRHRTGGILAVFAVHILADTTIGLLGMYLLR